jgi:hypothetical protein
MIMRWLSMFAHLRQLDLHCAARDKKLDASDKAGVFEARKTTAFAISSG